MVHNASEKCFRSELYLKHIRLAIEIYNTWDIACESKGFVALQLDFSNCKWFVRIFQVGELW